MTEFNKWTLEAIRDAGLAWLEESRFEFSTTTYKALAQIISGKTIVLITDSQRRWFEQYIISSLNRSLVDRPIIPIVTIDSLYPNYTNISGAESIDMLEAMLEQAFGGNYFFWYVGRGDDKRADIAKRSNSSYLWIMDEDFHSALTLKSYDKKIDIKLIELFKLFDVSLNAALFGEVDVLA